MLRGIFRAYNRILDRDHLSDGPRENIRLRLWIVENLQKIFRKFLPNASKFL